MSAELDDATKPNIDESPFEEDLEATAKRVVPERDETTIPTETAPLPRPYGEEDEEQTAVLGAEDPPTDIEIHAPVMLSELTDESGGVSPAILLAAAAALLVLALGCVLALIIF